MRIKGWIWEGAKEQPDHAPGSPPGLAPHPMVMIWAVRAYLATSPGARERAGEMAHCQHPELCSPAQGGGGEGCGDHGEVQAGAEIRRH